MWSKLALVGTARGLRRPRPTAPRAARQQPPRQARVREARGRREAGAREGRRPRPRQRQGLDSKNLDVLKDNQERALIDVAAAAFCGLLFAGVYGAVVFALGWFAAAPSTDALATGGLVRARASRRRCRARRSGALVGMLLTFKIFSIPTDIFAVLISVVVISARARGQVVPWTRSRRLRFRSAVRRRRVAQVAQPPR